MNVAIIGAGAAGSSAAFHLSQFAAEASLPINLTVFERNSYVGGRSTTVNAHDDPNSPIELGASIFVKVNHILVKAAQDFNLTTSAFGAARSANPEDPSLGIWDGNKFVVTLSPSGATWWDTAKLLYRYGLSPIRTMNLMKSTVGKFLSMYDEPIFPFASLTHAVYDVDLVGATSTPGTTYLLDNGVSAQFAHDVIQASTRVNYAQNLELFHGLETMVCMATDGAMAVEGGNWQIFDQFISSSGARLLLDTTVEEIYKNKDDMYTVDIVQDGERTSSHTFNTVVIAAPFQSSKIKLGNSSRPPKKIDYVNLHVTLFTSPLSTSPGFFNLPSDARVPRTILTTLQCDDAPETCFNVNGTAPDFYSVSLLEVLENPKTGMTEYAYKIFSQTEPTDVWLLSLLGADSDTATSKHYITWIHRKLWQSYPLELPRQTFEELELDDGLWYTGGMESFISTMETNALMGKNIAKLIVDRWDTLNLSERMPVRSDQIVLGR